MMVAICTSISIYLGGERSRERFIRPAQHDAFHDDLILCDPGVLAHHGGLAVDRGIEPARPGGVNQASKLPSCNRLSRK
jgi:hypothetical protein